MFILDTNVVSELMRPRPDPVIESWFAEHATSSLLLTAASEAELHFGLVVMPIGKRRAALRLRRFWMYPVISERGKSLASSGFC